MIPCLQNERPLPVPRLSPVQYVFPDLSPLIRHINGQIAHAFQAHSQGQLDKQLAEEYELIVAGYRLL
ncbi:TPA: hypothetical protein MH565_27770 [Klebsiella pneumoniae]|uniref:Uncharacterized protein n=1 Tax=Klebsiella pneumoniae CG43 TaxID=1244085 RepID=Q6U5R5_KLEPN|nr:hypothetical protein LV180 [Klebsiella pneumoniae CG43]ARV43179.1 hypothetical protein RJA_28975 [Klebsiella pneumoniae subsp. pneumoniae]AUN60104.1 hypothetical protein C0076_28015 [Klebsiella pneumoniae]RHX57207.1 hypothetical protein D3O91_07950 [Escherichia coli]CDI13643.1 conserved hypothetical protein [Klebsiella pneumoniae subsp. pneumoniae T69]BAH66011.1 hypothetical protein KP1_p101 [Klebsiella pneumoniae subsp. pneumoniae NTUH-K2044]